MNPETIEVLKHIGQGLGVLIPSLLLGLHGGKKIERKRNNGWDETSDPDRRVIPHKHEEDHEDGEYVREQICSLRHELVEKDLKNIITGNNEIKRDIRAINKQLSGTVG